MFARYRTIILFASHSLLHSPLAVSGTQEITGTCDNTGECIATFDSHNTSANALCAEGSLIAAWHSKGTPILLQCQSNGTSEENKTYVLQKRIILGLNYGRYISLNYVKNHPTESVQGRFSTTPLCAPAESDKLEKSDFILLKKQPAQDRNSYCYEVTYLIPGTSNLLLFSNNAQIDHENEEYFLPSISSKTQKNIVDIAHQIYLWKNQHKSHLRP